MARALKVFRTPIGFHDAYVAATSRKAALAAWGADADLFARGVAEEVTDASLMEAPLTDPGEVIRVARGTAEEHLAALPPTPARKTKAALPPASKAKPRREPRPSRTDLDSAEEAIERSEKEHKARLRDLTDREAALARERRQAEREHAEEKARLEERRNTAKDRYDRAIHEWQRR